MRPLHLYWLSVVVGMVSLAIGSPEARAENWAIQLTGGHGPEMSVPGFVEQTLDFEAALSQLAISRDSDHRHSFYGIQDGKVAKYCARPRRPSMDEQISELKSRLLGLPEEEVQSFCHAEASGTDHQTQASFLRKYVHLSTDSPPVCEKSFQSLAQAISIPVTEELKGFNPAPADLNHLYQAIDQVGASAAARPDHEHHLLLNLSDHGDEGSGDISMGDDHSSVSPEALIERLEKVRSLKGSRLAFHVNVQGCYSEWFSEKLESWSLKNGLGRQVCVTANQAKELAAYQGDALVDQTYEKTFHKNLARYGNTLQAFACSMAADLWNSPISTLDTIVAQARLEQHLVPAAAPPDAGICEQPLGSFEDLKKKLKADLRELTKAQADQTRIELVRAYKKYILRTALSGQCHTQMTEGAKLASRLLSCFMDTGNPDALSWRQDGFTGVIKLLLKNASQGEKRNVSRLEEQLEFLKSKETTPEQLNHYKDAFCCLSYDFKTGTTPPFCNQ